MSLKPRFCTNLLSFNIVNRLFLNNHKTIDQVILSRARISHIFCIDYNKCFKSSRAFCCVDILFHKFYFFFHSVSGFLFTRSPKETANMTSGFWVELWSYWGPLRKKDNKCQCEVRRKGPCNLKSYWKPRRNWS